MIIETCPHCGGTACLPQNYSYKIRSYFVFVKCDVCNAQGKTYRSDTEPAADDWNTQACKDAIAAWNMRTEKTADGKVHTTTYGKFLNPYVER